MTLPINTLRDLLDEQLKVESQSNDGTISCVALPAASTIVKNNPGRVALAITNMDAVATITVRPQAPPSATTGFQLSPGQTLTLTWFDDLERIQYEWQGGSSGAAANVYFQEQVIVKKQPTPKGA